MLGFGVRGRIATRVVHVFRDLVFSAAPKMPFLSKRTKVALVFMWFLVAMYLGALDPTIGPGGAFEQFLQKKLNV